jgi:hypothetical protein
MGSHNCVCVCVCDDYWLHACALLFLFFDPEDRSDMFLRNVGWLLANSTGLYPRRQDCSLRQWVFGFPKMRDFLLILASLTKDSLLSGVRFVNSPGDLLFVLNHHITVQYSRLQT